MDIMANRSKLFELKDQRYENNTIGSQKYLTEEEGSEEMYEEIDNIKQTKTGKKIDTVFGKSKLESSNTTTVGVQETAFKQKECSVTETNATILPQRVSAIRKWKVLSIIALIVIIALMVALVTVLILMFSSKSRLGDKNLMNKTAYIEARQNEMSNKLQQQTVKLQQELDTMTNRAKLGDKNLMNKTAYIEARQNEMSNKLQQQTVKLQQELNTMANRVSLTACKDNPEDVSGVIKFTDVKTVNGINNLNSIRNSGIFTCEKSGIYLISVFILTNTKNLYFYVKKNGSHIADGYSSVNGYLQTTSVTLIKDLDVNDIISVTGSLFVYNGYHSCLTIVHIQ